MASKQVFVASPDDPIASYGVGDRIAEPMPERVRNRPIAIHEGSHAAVARALGDDIRRIEIEPSMFVQRAGSISRASSVVVMLAADAATSWADQCRIERKSGDDAAAYLSAIRAGCGGPCDTCSAFRALCHDGDGNDHEVMSAFRILENMAGAIVRHPDVWAAIEEIADALMKRGFLIGEDVHEICARHFDAGFVIENEE